MIERAIQDVEGQVRTMKLAFESHLGEKIRNDHTHDPLASGVHGGAPEQGASGPGWKDFLRAAEGKAGEPPENAVW